MRGGRAKPSRKRGGARRGDRAAVRGDAAQRERVNATAAKNRFGSLLEKVARGGEVVITRRDVPEAMLISIAEYERFTRAEEAMLGTLTRVFDDLFDRMQGPAARAAMMAAFATSPEELGRVALAAARRHGG